MPKNMSFEEWSKRSGDLTKKLDAIPGYREWSHTSRASRRNDISYAVSCKVPKEEVALENAFEEAWYAYLWATAELHEEAYGYWPTFEMEEIETDDPRLDIYGSSDAPDKRAEERKTKKS